MVESLENLETVLLIEAEKIEMMKLYAYLEKNDRPINSITEYMAVHNQLEAFDRQITTLASKTRQRKKAGQETAELDEEIHNLQKEESLVKRQYYRCQPYIVVSRCPFCQILIWSNVGVFSLKQVGWFHGGGKPGLPESQRCPHRAHRMGRGGARKGIIGHSGH